MLVIVLAGKFSDKARYSDGMTEPKSPRELYDFVRRMRYNLKTWLENLPLSLAIKDLEQHPCLPHVLQLQWVITHASNSLYSRFLVCSIIA